MPEDLWPPVVEATEDGEDQSTEQHVMEMSHNKVGVVLLAVGWHDGMHHARQPAEGKHRDESEAVEHRGREPHRSAPHCAEPIENLDSGGDRDRHSGDAETGSSCWANARCKHVVHPDAPTHEADRDAGQHNYSCTKEWLAAEDWQYLRNDAHAGQDQDVHLRMAEQPEQMLIEQRIATCSSIEEMGSKVAV